MPKITLIAFAAGLLLAGDGMRPRQSAADYPAHETVGGLTLASAVVPPDQVRKIFAVDLNKAGYILVEMAVYPESGSEIDISTGDFMLQIGSETSMVRAINPSVVASKLQRNTPPRQPSLGGNVGVVESSTIGYESGTDPNTGQRRHGVYTDTGVGVAVGPGAGGRPGYPPPSASADRDLLAMQQIEDLALPEGKVRQTLAGYLFFPKPSGKGKNEPYDIFYAGSPGRIHLSVPPPSRKQ